MARISTSALNLTPISGKDFFKALGNVSAFLRAAGDISLSGTGNVVHYFNRANAPLVAEGAAKPENTPVPGSVTVLPKKFVSVRIFTEEAVEVSTAFAQQIVDYAKSDIALEVDEFIASNTVEAGITTLGALPAVEVGSDADFETAVIGLPGLAYGLVLSNSMLGYMRALRGVQGNRYFDITADNINGMPYYVFESAERVGFVADWKRYTVGGQRGDTATKVRDQGIIGGVNLLETNSVAFITEAFIGFGAKPGAVIKIVPATS